jgi:hypothetical protein
MPDPYTPMIAPSENDARFDFGLIAPREPMTVAAQYRVGLGRQCAENLGSRRRPEARQRQ